MRPPGDGSLFFIYYLLLTACIPVFVYYSCPLRCTYPPEMHPIQFGNEGSVKLVCAGKMHLFRFNFIVIIIKTLLHLFRFNLLSSTFHASLF